MHQQLEEQVQQGRLKAKRYGLEERVLQDRLKVRRWDCGLVPRFEKGDAYFLLQVLLQDDNCRSENNHDMSSP